MTRRLSGISCEEFIWLLYLLVNIKILITYIDIDGEFD